MDRITRLIGSVVGLALGLCLVGGGVLFLSQAQARADLESLMTTLAFGEAPTTNAVADALAANPYTGPLPDGQLISARAIAQIIAGERRGGQDSNALQAARVTLLKQATVTPRNPYLWTQLASVEMALGARPKRVGQLLDHSFTTGRNAVAAWPARVAIGFRIWHSTSPPMQTRILHEATQMWAKISDQQWNRRLMRKRLTQLTLAAGLTDIMTPLIGTTPDDLAQWLDLLNQEMLRS